VERSDDRKIAVIVVSVCIVLAVGLLDFLTPSEADFGQFYMIPVVLSAWFVGRRAALVFAVVGITAELLADAELRVAVDATGPAVAVWNAFAHLIVLGAIAIITDAARRERDRWRAVDEERTTLLRVLEQELPRPLQAADWFARTFEEALGGRISKALQAQFEALRHHTREATFLATDLIALGQLRLGGLSFERRPTDLRATTREAVDGIADRTRVLLSVTPEDVAVLADADRLRHAISSVVARYLESSRLEPVTVMVRRSGSEGAVEISSRGRSLQRRDVEFAELLINGNGGRLVLLHRSSSNGSVITLFLPGNITAEGTATTPPARVPAQRT
jgi:signal transduction histidine kinase